MEQKSTEQQQARNLYFQSDLSQQQIADLLDVNRKTLYTWIKDGKWRRAKHIAKHAPCILAEQYLSQLGTLNNMIAQREERPYPTKEEADIMRKISMTLKNTNGNKKPIADNIELFIDFTQHLRLENFQVAKEFMPHMDKYIQSIIKKANGLDNPWKSYLADRAEDQEYEEWLSLQPKPEPTIDRNSPPFFKEEYPKGEVVNFPPGYFTNDYQPENVATEKQTEQPTHDSRNIDVAPPSPSEGHVPILSGAGVRPTRAEQPTQNSEVTPPSPSERVGVRLGVTNGVSPTPGNTPEPLSSNTITENDNTDLSTKENEKQGDDELDKHIQKSIDEWRELVFREHKRRRHNNDHNKAA